MNMASDRILPSIQHQLDQKDAGRDVYDDGYLRIEHDNYYVTCGGKRIQLSLKEFLILSRLARNPERVVSAEEIWHHAWGNEIPFNGGSLRVHMYNLRRKFISFGISIESMVNVGYYLLAARPSSRVG